MTHLVVRVCVGGGGPGYSLKEWPVSLIVTLPYLLLYYSSRDNTYCDTFTLEIIPIAILLLWK